MSIHETIASAEKSLRETDLDSIDWSQVMAGALESDASATKQLAPGAPLMPDGAPLSVLIVEPVLEELVNTANVLLAAGFRVTAVDCFEDAKPLLATHSPAILITSLRLGSHNGLHLVLRGKSLQPLMAAVVTCRTPDHIAQLDAESIGATFVSCPLEPDQLIACILRTYFRQAGETSAIRPPYEQRGQQRRATATPFETERRLAERRRVLPWLERSRRDSVRA